MKHLSHSKVTNLAYFSFLFVLLGLAVYILNIIRLYEFTMDDAYIIYRYASNLASGNGLVFNPGEYPQSEGLTSPLWAVLLSLGPLTGIDIKLLSKVLGVLFTALTAVIIWLSVYNIIKYLIDDRKSTEKNTNPDNYPGILSSAAVFIYLFNPYVAGNSISGMETSMAGFCYTAFLFATLVLGSIKQVKYMIYYAAGASVIFALSSALLRPELTLSIFVIYLLCIIFYKNNRKYVLASFGFFIVLGIIYFILRYNYYEMLFPLPFYVKQTGLKQLFSGLSETIRFIMVWSVAAPMFIILVIWLFKNLKSNPIFILTTGILIQLLYWIFPLHEMGFGYRYFQPLVPAVAVIIMTGTGIFFSFTKNILQNKYRIIISTILILPLLILQYIQIEIAHSLYIKWYSEGMSNIINIGKTLHEIDSTSHSSIGLQDCGAIPYYSNWRTVDLRGLNNRELALNYSNESIMNEIRIKIPDVIILFSADGNKLQVPKEMQYFHDGLIVLNYKYFGILKANENYYYRFYVQQNDKERKTEESFQKNCPGFNPVTD